MSTTIARAFFVNFVLHHLSDFFDDAPLKAFGALRRNAERRANENVVDMKLKHEQNTDQCSLSTVLLQIFDGGGRFFGALLFLADQKSVATHELLSERQNVQAKSVVRTTGVVRSGKRKKIKLCDAILKLAELGFLAFRKNGQVRIGLDVTRDKIFGRVERHTRRGRETGVGKVW